MAIHAEADSIWTGSLLENRRLAEEILQRL
jgi:hypothetical protein